VPKCGRTAAGLPVVKLKLTLEAIHRCSLIVLRIQPQLRGRGPDAGGFFCTPRRGLGLRLGRFGRSFHAARRSLIFALDDGSGDSTATFLRLEPLPRRLRRPVFAPVPEIVVRGSSPDGFEVKLRTEPRHDIRPAGAYRCQAPRVRVRLRILQSSLKLR